jgi:glutamine phosphoribosylpyrophosphate amidotransferase
VNAQPFCATTDAGPIALAHNGNLVNFLPIRRELEGRGDLQHHRRQRGDRAAPRALARPCAGGRLIDALSRLKGAWAS